MSIANAMQTLAEAMGDIIDGLHDWFKRLSGTTESVSIGDKVKVYHPETKGFAGHIAELRTDQTATVARYSDGVLVHVPRESIKEKYE